MFSQYREGGGRRRAAPRRVAAVWSLPVHPAAQTLTQRSRAATDRVS
jgi:hypothetical protein